MMATADLSAPFIQGAAMMARHPVRWTKATLNSYKALVDPNVMAKTLEHPRYKELSEAYSQSGGSLLQLQDFLQGMSKGQFATRIPVYGRILEATGRSYGVFLDLAKLEMFDAWRKSAQKSELPRIVETIENSLFMGRMEQIGLNPHRTIGERLILFAPAYYRGAAGLISTAVQRGVSGKIARQMLGSYAAAAVLVPMASYLAMGMDWEEIAERLNPTKGKFLKVPVSLGNGQRIEVGIGNILTQLVRLAGQASKYHTSDNPIDTGVEANPYLRFLRGRSAFMPGIGIELATGRDYFGQRITAKESVARHFAPFVLQSMFPRDKASISQRIGDSAFTFFGLNSYPESEYEKNLNQIDQLSRKIGGKPFSQLSIPQRAKAIYQFQRTPEYKKREPSPTDMERIIHLNAKRQAELQAKVGEDASEKLARMGLRLPGYRSTMQYKSISVPMTVSVPMTEGERSRYEELLANMYRQKITTINERSVANKPVIEREKWWSEQTETIGIEARKRLMREISAKTRPAQAIR
jgi:glycerol uptake facilitator-like aquaporin